MHSQISPQISSPTPTRVHFGYFSLVIAGLALFLGIFIWHVHKNPLRLDEVDYFQSMRNVVGLGLPIYYAGEVDLPPESLLPLSTRTLAGKEFRFYRFRPETRILKETFFALTDGNSRYTYAMWHPPLYIYLGSLVFRVHQLTAQNSAWLRYFNLIFSLGMFAGMAALSRALYPARYRAVMVVALLLYAANSLAVRGSVLIDYNATLGPCIAVWFAACYVQSEQQRRFHPGLMACAALAAFAGLGIAASLLAGAMVYILLWGRTVKPWGSSVGSIAAGTALFPPLFLAACRILNLPFSQPFLHNVQRAGIRPSLSWFTAQASAALKYGAFYCSEIGWWVIAVGVALWLTVLLKGTLRRAPARGFIPVTVLTGLLLLGSLRADAYGFPKYVLFLLPPLFVWIAGEALLHFFGDDRRLPVRRPLAGHLRLVIPVVLAALALAESWDTLRTLGRPGGTLYLGGEQGIAEIASALAETSAPDEAILSPKDVAFFADRKFVQWSGLLLSDANLVRSRITQAHIRYAAASTALLGATSPLVGNYLAEEFAMQARAGDFVLWVRAR